MKTLCDSQSFIAAKISIHVSFLLKNHWHLNAFTPSGGLTKFQPFRVLPKPKSNKNNTNLEGDSTFGLVDSRIPPLYVLATTCS
jgi:hypothetical protein